MNPISLLPKSGSNFKLYYLVPVSFVYLFSQFGGQIYLLFSLVTLIGAASRHAEGEALYGPDGAEKAELSEEEEIRRIGSMIFRDKLPFSYSATSSKEMLEEGNLQSKYWALIIVILYSFHLSLPVLYVVSVYEFYIHRSEIDFLGAILLFSLVALVVNGIMRFIWPNVSRMDQDITEIDPELQDTVEKFRYMLYADGISTPRVFYEPAEGGVFEIDCEVDYESSGPVQEDVNRVAVTFCSIVDRTSYPIDRANITLKTSDGVPTGFWIDSMWCKQVLDGRISSNQYLKRVDRTISVESLDEEK